MIVDIPSGILCLSQVAADAAASSGAADFRPTMWYIAPVASALALGFAMYFYRKMMAASDARTITMRADYDFAQLMVDHHQAAIDNSEALLQYGRYNTTKTLAQNIITDQRQEIAALQNWLTRNR